MRVTAFGVVLFGVVLFGAALRAAWNTIVEGSSAKLLTIVLVTASATLIGVLALPLLAPPARANRPCGYERSFSRATKNRQ